MMALRIRNWEGFQHYRGRRPPWIKLHRSLLDDPDWHALPDAAQALAPMLWLLASESHEGHIELDADKLAFRIRWDAAKLAKALEALIRRQFVEVVPDQVMPDQAMPDQAMLDQVIPGEAMPGDASTLLVPCLQLAPSERESEREDLISSPATPAHSTTRTARGAEGRGTRLAENWKPPASERAFAVSFGLDADKVADEFRDFWLAVPGAKGRKLDWPATFRNRCRELGHRRRSSVDGGKPWAELRQEQRRRDVEDAIARSRT